MPALSNTVAVTDKIVVVSNFTSSLDLVAALGRLRRWKYLRIDGSVSSEKRMKIIEHFNNPTGPFHVLLLSSRAGGVGINL